MLGGTVVDGVEVGNGEVVGLLLVAALLAAAGAVHDDLGDGALELVLGPLGQVGVVADKVGGGAVGGVDVDLEGGIGGDKGRERHEVLGEGTGLVGTNDGDTTESLDGGEGTNDGILLGHIRHSPGVDDSDDGLESLGDHGDGTDQTNLDGIDGLLSGLEEGGAEGAYGGDDDEDGQDLGNIVDLLKDGGLLLLDLGNEGCSVGIKCDINMRMA